MIIIYNTEYVQSLSSFGANLVEIFEVAERWVVVDVWVGVSMVDTMVLANLPCGNFQIGSNLSLCTDPLLIYPSY